MTPKKRARDEAKDQPCKFLKTYLESVSYHRTMQEEAMRAYYQAVDGECEAMGYPGMPFLSSESLSILPTEMEDTVSQRTENNNESIPRIENELKQDTVALGLDLHEEIAELKALYTSSELPVEVEVSDATNNSGVIADLHAKVAELEQTDSAKVIAALNAKVAELEANLCASELLNSNDDIDLEEEEEEPTNDTSSQDSKKSAMILLLKYLIKLLEEHVGSEYKDMSEEEKRAFGTVNISGVEIAKPLYDAWMEYIPANGVTNFIMASPECVKVVNNLFYKENEFAMPYMGEIGKDFNIGFIGSFNLKNGSMTYGTINEFIEPFSNLITSRRLHSSTRNARFDVGFIIADLCNRLLPSQALTDLNTVKQYMKNRPREGNEDLYELWDKLLPLLTDMNQSSEQVHKQLLPVLLKQIKKHIKGEKAVNCVYEFYSETAAGIFNDASSIHTAVEEAQGGSIPIGKTHHLCSGGHGSGNKSKDAMEQARDTITMMMKGGMTTDHQHEYTTQETKSILEVKNDAGITWMETLCSRLKFEREIDEQYQIAVNQRRLENKQRKKALGIATALNKRRDETDSKKIYITKDLNEPIRTSTVKEFTDELVRDHADVCKKKGEADKGVDREYIRLQRILKRLNTRDAVYPGGPKIADSEEKLKSNLAPNKKDILRDETDSKKIYIAKDLNEPIRTSTVKEFTDELVRDHADVCKKKGEADKGVDREYIRKKRILQRLNVRIGVYPGGPKIADSEEKLKSNLAPDTTDQDNSFGEIRAEDINVNDVICANTSRPGNQAYLKLIKEKKNRYKSPKNSKDKASIAEEVLDTMRKKNPPGRFLKKCTDSKTYTELSNKDARSKVVKALRLAK